VAQGQPADFAAGGCTFVTFNLIGDISNSFDQLLRTRLNFIATKATSAKKA